MTAKEKLSFLIRCGLRFSSDESRIMDIIREEVNKTPTTSEAIDEDPNIPAETRFCPNCGAKMKRH